MKKIIWVSLWFFTPALWAQEGKIVYADTTYVEYIKTIQTFEESVVRPVGLHTTASLQRQNLTLAFDDLRGERRNYYFKLVNCTYDWQKSGLPTLDFLNSYNEFPITTVDFSMVPAVPYAHYEIRIPTVKIPGNYVVLVYEDNEQNIALTQRIMIYDQRASFRRDMQRMGLGNLNPDKQLIDFTIEYSSGDLFNRSENVHVVMRQNRRWEMACAQSPFFVREDTGEMNFRQDDAATQFFAGNEFRFVDFRSLYAPGRNTQSIDRTRQPFSLYVNVDKPRTHEAYGQYQDMNGGYDITDLDRRNEPISNDYVWVTFQLKAPPYAHDVYVVGAFNQWNKSEQNKMTYTSATGTYSVAILLKQGIYDYLYWVDDSERDFTIEGNHFETENLYEVFVYNKSLRFATDLLVGYYAFTVNPR